MEVSVTDALRALISGRDDLAAARSAEEATVASRRVHAAAIVAAGIDGSLPTGARIGREAFTQAQAYLDRDAEEHVLDGLAHRMLNELRAEVPGPTTTRYRSIGKIALLNAVPGMLYADIAWRAAAEAPGEHQRALSAALGYWDRADEINALDPLASEVLDLLQTHGLCSPELRTAVEAACTIEVLGAPTTALVEAGLADATFDDVRAALAEVI